MPKLNINGEITSDIKKIKDEVDQHFEKLNQPHGVNSGDLEQIRKGECMSDNSDRNILKEEIREEEISRVLKGIKNGKAVGEDNIPNEFLKHGDIYFKQTLRFIFNSIVKNGIIPNIWKKSYTKLIHKGGSKNELDNYRGIAITSCVGKLFSKIQSNPINLRVGLKQGCVLSPILFSIYIMELGMRLENSGLGFNIEGINIPALLFADDIVVMGSDENQLSELLEMIGRFGLERKLDFNAKKSKVMVNWRDVDPEKDWALGGRIMKEGREHSIKINECKGYKYLGIKLAIRGGMIKLHEEAKIQEAKKQSGRVKTFSLGSCNKSFCAKVAWDKVISPSLLYGTETIRTSKKWQTELNKMEMDMGRFITGASLTCAKSAILGEIGWQSIKYKEAKGKLAYARRFE